MKKLLTCKSTMYSLTLLTSTRLFIEAGTIKTPSLLHRENSNKYKVNFIKISFTKNIFMRFSMRHNAQILSKCRILSVLTVVFNNNCHTLTSLFLRIWMQTFQILSDTEGKITVNGMSLSSKNSVGISCQHLINFIKIISLTMTYVHLISITPSKSNVTY